MMESDNKNAHMEVDLQELIYLVLFEYNLGLFWKSKFCCSYSLSMICVCFLRICELEAWFARS